MCTSVKGHFSVESPTRAPLSQFFPYILLTFVSSFFFSRVANARSDDTDVPNDYGDYDEDDDEIQSNQEEDYSSKAEDNTFMEVPEKRQMHQSIITTEVPTTQTSSHTEITCPTSCFCIQNSHFFLNCSNRDLTQIPKNIPNNVYEIDLSNNNITQVDVETFVGLPHLYKINLANNQIEDVERQAFRDLENLRIIDLTNNSLTQMQPETFNWGVAVRATLVDWESD